MVHREAVLVLEVVANGRRNVAPGGFACDSKIHSAGKGSHPLELAASNEGAVVVAAAAAEHRAFCAREAIPVTTRASASLG